MNDYSSVIIDNTVSTVSFLPYIESRGYRIRLETRGNWIVATLVGTQQASSHSEGVTIRPFEAYGKTKEEALDKLREKCSGQTYHPDAREQTKTDHFFLCLGKDAFAGKECQFPTFSSLS